MPSTLTRRTLLAAGTVAGAGAIAAARLGHLGAGTETSPIPRKHEEPRAPSAPPGRLVVVFLRGGQDHLSVAVPLDDAAYHDRRPTIAVPEEVALPLDDKFGFHPVLAGLHDLFSGGRLAVIPAAGNPAGDRSHFFAQDLAEYGDVEVPQDGNGWIGRHLTNSSTPDPSPFRALTLGNNVTTSMRGYPALGLPGIQTFGLGGLSGATAALEPMLRSSYDGSDDIEIFGQQALDAVEQVATLDKSSAGDPVASSFGDIAVLLEADLGVEVVSADLGGWDTHNDMGTHDRGEMHDLLAGLDKQLAGFQADLDTRGLDDVTTVVMTEFGRRVAENGSGGCDHGWGSVVLVMGGAASGGVYGSWLGLSDDAIGERGDVPVTTDFRDVLGDLVRDVLGADPAKVFPGHEHQPVGATTT